MKLLFTIFLAAATLAAASPVADADADTVATLDKRQCSNDNAWTANGCFEPPAGQNGQTICQRNCEASEPSQPVRCCQGVNGVFLPVPGCRARQGICRCNCRAPA
ncbi:hypothetical protein CERZMDRAFT_84448 [Cercospora zeae-maydis SCOH1-5]|uniref:Uncharacterized protein n=1 Tax=Cercospora zeae-maydis SCOH1-5 TaxID=717836 RepID=A0A6A6FHK5_9PEZI|nr:hypothetical protein CERZMDRAFT_84448 [Cercospora zeae-maydis SCOH1-5]